MSHFLCSPTVQFYHSDIKINESERTLVLPDKSPVPVRYRPVWGFMKYAAGHDEHCWTAMKTGMQGERLIEGTYHDYIVSGILSADFNSILNLSEKPD